MTTPSSLSDDDRTVDGNLRLTNVVFKVKITNIVSELKRSKIAKHLSFTDYANFSVIRGICHLTLIAFTKSGHVNITGVRSFDQVRDILMLLSDVIDRPSIRIDNIQEVEIVSSTTTGTVDREVNLARIVYRYQNDNDYNDIYESPDQDHTEACIWLRKESLLLYLQYGHFPSLIIRHPQQKGCIQLFCSGKFNIVGCRHPENIIKLWRLTVALTKM